MPWYACPTQWREVMNGYKGVAIVGTWVLSCCVPHPPWRFWQRTRFMMTMPTTRITLGTWAVARSGQEWPKPQPPLLNFLSFPIMSSNSMAGDHQISIRSQSWLIMTHHPLLSHYSASLHGLHLHRNLHLPASPFHPGSRDDPRISKVLWQSRPATEDPDLPEVCRHAPESCWVMSRSLQWMAFVKVDSTPFLSRNPPKKNLWHRFTLLLPSQEQTVFGSPNVFP